jgi:PAS domain S-box-containing protein
MSAVPAGWERQVATSLEIERLVDLSVDMLCVASMSGRFIAANPAWTLTLGWPESELRGRKAIDFVHPDDRRRTLVEAKRLEEPGGEVIDFETRFAHRDGTQRWLTWSARSDGRRLYAVARDVTAMRAARERFRAVFEHAPIGMAAWSLEGEHRPVEVNRAICEILGYPADDLIHRVRLRDVVHPDDFDLGRDEMVRLLRGEIDSCSFEKRFVRGDGKVIWAEVVFSIARDATGSPEYGLCQIQDVTRRREADDALRQSEQRLRKLVQTAHEGIWVLDADGRTAFANSRMGEILGYGVEEMLGRPALEFVNPADRDLARARLAARAGGVSESYEMRFVRKDGRGVWVRVSGSPLKDEDGRFSGVLGMMADITDVKLREAALRASEERYRKIIETTSEGVWMIDADHRTTYVNRRMAEMLGYTVEEMLGKAVDEFQCSVGDPIQAGLGQREVCYRRKDGSEMWGLLSGSPLTDGSGTYGGALAIIADITARKHADEATAKLAAIVEASPDAIFSTDRDGRITAWNGAAEALYGYRADELLGESVWMLAAPGTVERVREVSRRLRDGEPAVTYRTTAVRKDGKPIEIDPSVSAIRDAKSRTVGFVAIVRAAGAESLDR